jgi:hypothetical protein
MSIPKKHHYLPEFYLGRWAQNGKVVSYERVGPSGKLDCKLKSPGAVGYQPYLYHLPDVADPTQSQSLESQFFQQLDSKAAVALRKFDQLENPTIEDHEAICQFAISLLYRTPTRLSELKEHLRTQLDGAPYAGLTGTEFEEKLKATTNRLLAMLVGSPNALTIFSKFKAGRIVISGTSKTLLTSDRPMTVSAQFVANDAFMLLPYAPDRLLILTHHKAIADAFATQNHGKLVSGINQAIVEQSEDIVIATDKGATRMIDRLFLRPQPGRIIDPIGLIRRKSPLVDLRPKPRQFSRHDKAAIRAVGQ